MEWEVVRPLLSLSRKNLGHSDCSGCCDNCVFDQLCRVCIDSNNLAGGYHRNRKSLILGGWERSGTTFPKKQPIRTGVERSLRLFGTPARRSGLERTSLLFVNFVSGRNRMGSRQRTRVQDENTWSIDDYSISLQSLGGDDRFQWCSVVNYTWINFETGKWWRTFLFGKLGRWPRANFIKRKCKTILHKKSSRKSY